MLNFMNKKRKTNGFTLIELIIVIAIIAILAAIAVPKYLQVKEKSNIKADVASAKEIANEVSTLIADETITNQVYSSVEVKTGGNDAGNTVAENLDGIPKGKAKDHVGKNFKFSVDANQDVTVSIDNAVVYPADKADYPYDGSATV